MLGPESIRSRTGASASRDSTSAALSCEPTPMPAQRDTLPAQRVGDLHAGADRGVRLVDRHRRADARVARAVRDLARQQPRMRRQVLGDAASTTVSSKPWMRANTDTGSCAGQQPGDQLGGRCARARRCRRPRARGRRRTSPSAGRRKRGFSVFCISPRRIASGSSSPRLPVVSAAPLQLVAQRPLEQRVGGGRDQRAGDGDMSSDVAGARK